MHFAEYIAGKLKEFSELEVGYPAGSSSEEWKAQLNKIIIPLERYAHKFNYGFEQENEITYAGQQAMRELADIFPALWI
jgi:hypothetical protein